MLPIADQTAGPNGLKFFEDNNEWPGVLQDIKKSILKKKKYSFQHYFFNILL